MRKILVRTQVSIDAPIHALTYSIDMLNLWKTNSYCIDIMDCETGEMLYIKGLLM